MISESLPAFGKPFTIKIYFQSFLFLFMFIFGEGIQAQEALEQQQSETKLPKQEQETGQESPRDSVLKEDQIIPDKGEEDLQNLGQSESEEPEQDEINSKEEELIEKSLALDINTATVEELTAWNRILGLRDYGDMETLRSQLREYYNLGSSAKSSAQASSDARQIKIESADRTEYLTFKVRDGKEESVIELSGRVEVNFTETELKRTHKIKADTIIFNRENETISAIGDIEYIVDTDGREERFSGENLILRTEKWTGVIFRGTSERTQKVNKQTVDFFFKGEDIIRSGSEIVVLNEGVITSDSSEAPYYSLKAEKIWITGPGEWGLLDAVIYVGHIPTFYIPFYWKPGNDLVFNPVIGTQNRLGYYIQTTTYLAGAKDYGDQFSIMGFGDSGSGSFKVERDGWFAVRKRLEAEEKVESKNYLKYMLDTYTNLGAMTGFKGEFPSLGKTSLKFDTRIAVSRSVNPDGNPNFSAGGEVRQYWHTGYLADIALPFRWYATMNMKRGSWSLDLSSYSDREFLNDFGERRENFDWLSFFLGEEDEPEKTSILSDSSLRITGKHNFKTSQLAPWISSFSMDNFSAYIKWKTKTNTDPALNLDTYNPGKQFYYPYEIMIPKVEFSLSGQLPQLKIPFKKEKDNSDEEAANPSSLPDDKEKDVVNEESPNLPSLSNDKKEVADQESSNPPDPSDEKAEALRFSEYYDSSISLNRYKNIMEASLNYKIKSVGVSVESFSDSSKWTTPQDIEFKFRPQRIKTTPSATLGYNLGFIDNNIKLSGSTKFSLFYQFNHDLFNSGIEINDAEKKESYKYSKMNWENDLRFTINPLKSISSLSSSSLSYVQKVLLYKKEYDSSSPLYEPQFTDDWIRDEKEYFKSHSATATLKWKPGIFNTSSSVTVTIPPLDEKYTFSNSLGFSYSGLSASLSQKTDYQESKETPLEFKPLIFSLTWSGLNNKIKTTQSLSYDLQEGRMKESKSTLKAWGLTADFVADYSKSYTWDRNNYIWKESEEEFAPKSFALKYSLSGEKLYLWKNRISTKTTTTINWKVNLRKITENKLDFSITQNFAIYKFIDLKVSLTSENKAMFLYFPQWREELGITEEYDFFLDLFKSFNIIDPDELDRKESRFNMKKLTLSVVHHLKNWDLNFDYSGWPTLNKDEKKYEWKSEFSISLVWNPLPIFNQKSKYKDDKWSVESFKSDS